MLRFLMIGAAILVALVVGVGLVSHLIWDRTIASEAASLTADVRSEAQPVITGEMLAELPHPVQRHLLYAGVVGRSIPSIVRLTQSGRIRGSSDADWMSFEAEQVYSTDPPGFVWRAWLPGRSIPLVMGRDVYLDGESSISMRMLGLLTVAEERGDDLAEAGLTRYLNEMMWFPMAYLDDAVTWEPIDENSARLTMTDQGRSVSAVLMIDDEGQLTNFTAERFNTETGQMETWETPITAYGELGGLKLPVTGQAVWVLEGSDFAYIELEVTSVEYE